MKDESIDTERLNARIKNQGYFIAEYQLKEIEILRQLSLGWFYGRKK